MFTAEDVKAAHSKVKSGADFPAYIQEIKSMGVTHYECYVSDGHTDYHGENHTAQVAPKYPEIKIADTVNLDTFIRELKAHQQGQTDYMTFIKMCAETGITKWIIDISAMTCTYYDNEGKKVLEETIPG